MKKNAVGAVLGALVLLVAGSAMAITRTPVTFIITITDLSSGVERITPNSLHVRDQMFAGIVSGDLTGTIDGLLNTNLNVTNPSVGFAGIQIRSTFTLMTDVATWVGTVTDAGPLGRGTNIVVAHGTDGSKIFGKLFGQDDGTFLVEGIIVAP